MKSFHTGENYVNNILYHRLCVQVFESKDNMYT